MTRSLTMLPLLWIACATPEEPPQAPPVRPTHTDPAPAPPTADPEPDPKRSPASLDSHQGDRRAVGTVTDDTPTTTRAPATTPTADPNPDPNPDPDPDPVPPTAPTQPFLVPTDPDPAPEATAPPLLQGSTIPGLQNLQYGSSDPDPGCKTKVVEPDCAPPTPADEEQASP